MRFKPQINRLIHDFWQLPLRELSPNKRLFIRHARILLLVFRGLNENNCLLRASALTFYALLSVGPVLALVLGIAKGFGLQKRIHSEVLSILPVREEILNRIANYAQLLLENTRGGIIAGFSVAVLLWSAIKLFNHLEKSVNEIWRIREKRPWKRKISNYLSFLFIAPLIFLIYSSIPAFIASQLESLASNLPVFAGLGPYILVMLKVVPCIVVWSLFSFIYIMIPNTHVKAGSGFLAGFLAGTAYLLIQWGFIEFQVHVTVNNPIYGSLMAFPLFLAWLNMGWVILLVGGEYAYAHQNLESLEFNYDIDHISHRFKRLLSLQIVHLIVERFANEKAPLCAAQIARAIDMPVHPVSCILEDLIASGLISHRCDGKGEELTYQPASDINRWSITYVLDRLNQQGINEIPRGDRHKRQVIENTIRQLEEFQAMSPANRLIKDL